MDAAWESMASISVALHGLFTCFCEISNLMKVDVSIKAISLHSDSLRKLLGQILIQLHRGCIKSCTDHLILNHTTKGLGFLYQ